MKKITYCLIGITLSSLFTGCANQPIQPQYQQQYAAPQYQQQYVAPQYNNQNPNNAQFVNNTQFANNNQNLNTGSIPQSPDMRNPANSNVVEYDRDKILANVQPSVAQEPEQQPVDNSSYNEEEEEKESWFRRTLNKVKGIFSKSE